MQSLFILPITYFINRLLYPYSMSYIRLSYDETTLIEFNGSKLKMNPCLSHLTDTPLLPHTKPTVLNLSLPSSLTSHSPHPQRRHNQA